MTEFQTVFEALLTLSNYGVDYEVNDLGEDGAEIEVYGSCLMTFDKEGTHIGTECIA